MNNYQDMKYNDLKSLAKERGLDATGTKEELLARLSEADGAPTPPEDAPQGDDQDGGEAPQASNEQAPVASQEAAPQPTFRVSEAQERQSQQKADRALRESARKMKEHLDAQPKVSIMIPLDQGVDPEQAKKIPFHINLNGYVMDIPKGRMVEVPKQVAEVIWERLESEGKIGNQWRADRDAQHAAALAG